MIRRIALPALGCLTLFLIAGCGGKVKETGPDVPSQTMVPQIASATPGPQEVASALAVLRDFDGQDRDQNGTITLAEQSTASADLFAAIDTSQDGTVTVDELNDAKARLDFAPGRSAEAIIAAADNDGDGKLTLAEWMANSNAQFAATDLNGDGVIDRAEWDARRAQPLDGASAASPAASASSKPKTAAAK